MLRITAKWWLVVVWLSLPKLLVAHIMCLAKISCLYISGLKIKDRLYTNVISKLTTM